MVLFGTLLTAAGFGAEKEIQLRLAKPELRILFKGITQAGEKTQSFEIREPYSTNPDTGKLVPNVVQFYLIHDPDCDTGFWAPEILKRVIGFEPTLERVTADTYHLYYYVGNHGLRRETWRLSKEKGPTLEKEEDLERRERPSNKKP
jgi:hypothetical protein